MRNCFDCRWIDLDTLENLDNALDRDKRTHSADYRDGWDQAFQVIYDWMKGQSNATAKESEAEPGNL